MEIFNNNDNARFRGLKMKKYIIIAVTMLFVGVASAQECRLYQVLHNDGLYHDYCYYPEWNPYCLYGIYDPYTICDYGAGPVVTPDDGSIQQTFSSPSPNPSPGLAALADMLESPEPSGVPDTGYDPGTDAMGPY